MPLSDDGLDPATHYGCNWVNCPHETQVALKNLSGVSVSQNWSAAREEQGLRRIESHE